ncbi:MAG: HAMP domain-containing protein [Thermoleophilaceae bacterium]|nr:HAMP domain-containing protein [Thermoleophilaceae bacterium]
MEDERLRAASRLTRSLLRAQREGERRSGAMIIARAAPVLTIGVVGSNLAGVVILYGLVSWVIPVPELRNDQEVRVVNLALLAIYLLFAVTAGSLKTLHDINPVRRWLLEDRPPTSYEQELALLGPSRLLRRLLLLWGIGVVLFTALNAVIEPGLGLVVAIAGIFAGLGTCAFSYLLAERSVREVARRALEDGPREHVAVPGVTTRVMLTWAISTGAPVLGVVLIVAGITLNILPDNFQQLRWSTMLICSVALFVGVQAMFMVSRSISDPIKSVQHGIERVAAGDLSVEVPVFDASEVGLLQGGFNDMVAGLRERERVRDLFGRHVGEDVAEQALLVGIELGGEVRDVAVIFVDVVGSTEMAASRPAAEVVEMLNRFFAVVIDAISRFDGSVNKFEGDAALCIFGAPVAQDDAAGDALAAARAMTAALRRELPEVGVGIGVSYGSVVAGNVGSAERHEYTVIGDPVNEAARLTEIAKSVDGGVVASGAALAQAREAERNHWTLGDSVLLRGRPNPTQLATPVI